MNMMTPSSPSEFGNEIDDLSEAYSPQQLQQKYAITKELKYLLALQKVTSAVQEAERSLAASQEQMPGTVRNQLEQGLMERAESVAGLLGKGQQPQPQQPQRQQPQQPPMMARGGIIGYDEGGDVEQEADISWEEIASAMGEAGVEIVEDMKQNPLPYLAGVGMMLVPGGIAASGARGLAGLGSIANRAGLFKKLNQVFKKRTPREKKFDEVRDSNQREAAGRTKLDEKPTPSRVDGRGQERADVEVTPGGTAIPKDIRLGRESTRTDVGPYKGQPSGVSKGQEVGPVRTPRPDAVKTTAQVASGIDALRPEAEPTLQVTPPIAGSVLADMPEREDKAGDESDNQGVASLPEARTPTDFQGLAKDKALRAADINPELKTALQTAADQDISGVRSGEVSRYKEAVGADDKLRQIREANEKQLETFQKQLAPEKIRRKNRLKAIAAGARGGTGIGQITANMIDAYYGSEEGGEELERLMAKTERDGKLKLIDIDLGIVQNAEESARLLLTTVKEDKRSALKGLSELSKGDLASINDYADRLQQSEDNNFDRQLKQMQLISDRANRMTSKELARDARTEGSLQKLMQLKQQAIIDITEIERARYPNLRALDARRYDTEDPLSEEELQQLQKMEVAVEAAINQRMDQLGIQDGIDRLEAALAESDAAVGRDALSVDDILGIR
jgi:hypothetical protein